MSSVAVDGPPPQEQLPLPIMFGQRLQQRASAYFATGEKFAEVRFVQAREHTNCKTFRFRVHAGGIWRGAVERLFMRPA